MKRLFYCLPVPVICRKLIVYLAIIIPVVFSCYESHCYPLHFRDSSGRDITLEREPVRAVSLVPSITEIICRIGAGERLEGITRHCTYPSETSCKTIVGGFLEPDLNLVKRLNPDIVFYNDIQGDVVKGFEGSNVILVDLETEDIETCFSHIELLGKIFNRQKNANEIIAENRQQIDLIQKKVALIPENRRKRVMRLMGRDSIMTPGDDSFQNEIIELAGGIPPRLNKKGHVVEMTKEEILEFNPGFIYGCGDDRIAAEKFFSMPGYKEIDAVKNYQVYYYPCDLTCRAATNTGYFISWLAAEIYSDEFAEKDNLVLREKVEESKQIDVKSDYIKDCRIDYSTVNDYPSKTLIVEFTEPMSIVSTLEGLRHGIKAAGNHYAPLSWWSITHREDFEDLKDRVLGVLGQSRKDTSILFTGADVDNLAMVEKSFRSMKITALVTAGVTSNAIRTSRDEGSYYEPGTINIIILPGMKLTERAMTRAVITATEAKTAALQDLDIRSSYSPEYQATGTGTDNMIIVQGSGDVLIDNAGGHTKMGELIAKAVYEGVREAIYKQNGIIAERNIFQRLADRNIDVSGLLLDDFNSSISKEVLLKRLETLLLDPVYASFTASAMTISDDYENGLIKELSGFKSWCSRVIYDISGAGLTEMQEFVENNEMPVVLKMALNALLNGIYQRELRKNEQDF